MRQIVSDTTGNDPVGILTREFIAIAAVVGIMRRAIGVSLKGDRRNGHHRKRFNPGLKVGISWFSIRRAKPENTYRGLLTIMYCDRSLIAIQYW